MFKLALGVLVAACGIASADLVNGGFETADTGPTDASGWTQLGFGGPNAAAVRSDAMPFSGDWSIYLEVDGEDGIGTRAFASQSGIAVSAGAETVFSLYAKTDGIGPGVVGGLSIEFFDAGGASLGVTSEGYAGGLTSIYQLVSVSATAPTGAVTATVAFDIAGGAFAASDGNVYADDASFVVPSSGSVALLGLSGLVGLRRRR